MVKSKESTTARMAKSIASTGFDIIDDVLMRGDFYRIQADGAWRTTEGYRYGEVDGKRAKTVVKDVLADKDGNPMKISVMYDRGNGTIQPASTYVRVSHPPKGWENAQSHLYIEFGDGNRFLVSNIPSSNNYESVWGRPSPYMPGSMDAIEDIMHRYR